jgi:tetratricopeptide (TPR) repeat protein
VNAANGSVMGHQGAISVKAGLAAMRHLAIVLMALAGSLGLCAPSAAWAQTSRDWNVCRSNEDKDALIAACGRIIDAGSRLSARDKASAYNNRALGYHAKGDFTAAIHDFGEAIRLLPENTTLYENRAISYHAKRDFAAAVGDYADAIRLSPKDPSLYDGRGNSYYALHDFAAAIRDYGEAIRLSPKSVRFYFDRSWAYLESDKIDLALNDANEAIRIDPKYAMGYSARGYVYKAQGSFEAAIADFTESIRLNSKNTDPFNGRGLARQKKGDLDGAIADFSEAIRLDPAALWYKNRGDAYLDRGDRESALADYNEAVRLNPKYANAHNGRGLARYKNGDLDGAIAAYSEAIRLDPDDAAPYSNRGYAYYDTGDRDSALADYNNAIHRNPKLATAYNGRCRVRYDKGDRGAIDDCNKAIELDPKFPAAFTNRGLAHQRNNDIEWARGDFKSSLALPEKYSTGKWAHETARAHLRLLDQAGQAVAALAAPVAAEPSTDRRIALIIGNSAYKAVAALPNPNRDADALAETLRGIGFQQVRLEHDLAREKLIEVLRAFARDAAEADWAVIYFAGHGLEMGGINYVIPVDAKLETDRDVQYEAIPLDQILGSVEGARRLRLVVLDACRDNPFVRRMTKSVASRSVGRGLAYIEPQGGTLVAYAAKSGEIALDGSGDNSPFVSALLKYMPTPGLEIGKLFRKVRDDVLSATGRKQEPFIYGSLPGDDLYFVSGK